MRINDAIYSVSFDTLKPKCWASCIICLLKHGGVVPREPSAADIDRLFEQANTSENDSKSDIDGNSLVNQDDVMFIVEAVFETHTGDSDLDGDVDFRDFLILAFHFGESGGWAQGDFNGDQSITIEDFHLLAANFGEEPPAPEARFRDNKFIEFRGADFCLSVSCANVCEYCPARLQSHSGP